MCVCDRRKEALTIRQTLDNLRFDLSVDDEDEGQQQVSSAVEPSQEQAETMTNVWNKRTL